MQLKKLYKRSQNILIRPDDEFANISRENKSVAEINWSLTVPLSLFIAIAALISSTIANIHLPLNSFVFVILDAFIVFLLMFGSVYLSGRIIMLLGSNITGSNKNTNYYNLNANSQIPFLLTMIIVKLFPSLSFIILLAFYSIYLFYQGSKILTTIPEEKRTQFTLLSILIIITTFIICSQILNLVYTEIIKQFSTFAML